jgi:acetyl-CoA synthetase
MASTEHHVDKLYAAKGDLKLEQYKVEHKQSIEDPQRYWMAKALENLDWFRKPETTLQGTFEHGDVRWFEGGKLNLSYNALDRHLNSPTANELALVWEVSK